MKLPGPFYKIPVRRVGEKYLNRKFKKHLKKGEKLAGFFDGENIWITSDCPHTLLHEWYHAWVHQISQHKPDEESQCDMFANIWCELFDLESAEDVIKKINNHSG